MTKKINEYKNPISGGGSILPNKNEIQVKNIEKKKSVINEQIEPLEKNLLKLDNNIKEATGGLFKNNNEVNKKNSSLYSIFDNIKMFFKSELYTFMKYYLYFIVLFTIIFYIILHINNNTKNKLAIIETKIFFYMVIVVIFIIINDILESPIESINKFILIILITLLLIYISTYLIEHYYVKDGFYNKLIVVIPSSILIFIVMSIYIYFSFHRKNKNNAIDLYNSFNYGIIKNLKFTIFLVIYLYIYYGIYYILNVNSASSNILKPFILGIFLVFFIFSLIIYIGLKLKIINRLQVLNTFISLYYIAFFLFFVCLYIFMSSLKSICDNNEDKEQNNNSLHEEEYVSLLILGSIFIILWLDDSRNWKQIGSLLFVIITIFTLYCMFYYSNAYPSTGILSFWLFIEWLIIIFFRKENSKNSIHYVFMKT